MIPPKIEESTKEERRVFVIDAWKCLHDRVASVVS